MNDPNLNLRLGTYCDSLNWALETRVFEEMSNAVKFETIIMKILIAVFVFVSTCFCGTNSLAAEDGVWSFGFETQVRSEYLAKIGLVLYDKPIVVNDISVSYDSFFGGVWNATALGNESYGSTFGDETDLYVGWAHQYDWIKFKTLGSVFFLKHLSLIKDDIWILEQEVSFPKVPIFQPYVTGRIFGEISDSSPERGAFLWAGLRRSQPLGFNLAGEPAKLNFDWMNGYSDGALHRDPGFVFSRVTFELPLKISKNLELVPSALFQVPIFGQASHDRSYTKRNEAEMQIALRWRF